MRRIGRKEITVSRFIGVASDGGFVFMARVYLPDRGNDGVDDTPFKVLSYQKGIMEIAFDYGEGISRVAQVVAGMFSKKSNFANLDCVILNYNNICLQIGKNTGKKDIICMMMKAMSMPKYKDANNDVFVDIGICQKMSPLKDSDKQNLEEKFYLNNFKFREIFGYDKNIWFKNPYITSPTIMISSIKDGIVAVDVIVGTSISKFIAELKKFFVPYSNLYGIKAVEIEINHISIRIDERNIGKVLDLYHKGIEIESYFSNKQIDEYFNSPKYIHYHTKELKKKYRKQVVVDKVKCFQKPNTDFTFANEDKQKKWEHCKEVNSKSTIDYIILWAQYMEYLMTKYDKKLSDIYELSISFADVDGISHSTYKFAFLVLSDVWKYGKELRMQRYHY